MKPDKLAVAREQASGSHAVDTDRRSGRCIARKPLGCGLVAKGLRRSAGSLMVTAACVAAGGCGDTNSSTDARAAEARPTAAPAQSSPPKPVAWILLGTADEGRSLIVRPRRVVSQCVDFRAVAKDDGRRISVTVSKETSRCGGESIASAEIPQRIMVRISGGVRGQTVTGPRRTEGTVVNGEGRGDAPLEVPGLIGLSVRQARAVAKTFNTTVTLASGPKHGYVASQSPNPGTAEPDPSSVSVSTKSR